MEKCFYCIYFKSENIRNTQRARTQDKYKDVFFLILSVTLFILGFTSFQEPCDVKLNDTLVSEDFLPM